MTLDQHKLSKHTPKKKLLLKLHIVTNLCNLLDADANWLPNIAQYFDVHSSNSPKKIW